MYLDNIFLCFYKKIFITHYNGHSLTGTTKHESCRDAISCVSTGYQPVCIHRLSYKNHRKIIVSLEFFIAGKYLKAKRKEGFISLITLLSVAGVTVGVMALVIVIAVMSGAEIEFRKRILGVEPHILIMEYSGKFSDYKGAEEKIRHIKGVNAISPLVFGQTMIRSASGLSGAVVRGIEPASGLSLIKGFTASVLAENLRSGKEMQASVVTDNSERPFPGIIMGRELAKHVGVTTGDKVVLMVPGGMISPVGHMPSMTRFLVTGVFDSGMYEYDSSLAYVHLQDAQKLMGMKGRISALGVWVHDLFQSPQIKSTIVDDLGSAFYGRD